MLLRNHIVQYCTKTSVRSIAQAFCFYSSTTKNGIPKLRLPTELVSAIQLKANESKALLEKLRKNENHKIMSVTVQTALGGMRGARVLLCETSSVDPLKGLSYRGHLIQDLINKIPPYIPPGEEKKKNHNALYYPASESLLWLLLTGSIPTPEQIENLRKTVVKRMKLPEHVVSAVRSLPTDAHPMTQLITGVTACQTESVFAQMYSTGLVPKKEQWKYALEDGLTLLAKLPTLASWVYRRISIKPELNLVVPTPNLDLDWSGNISQMMGFHSDMATVIRLYMFLHADHEGGNVSAHAAHLVGSALADPYLAYAASMAGLAAPLHGLANQESLLFFRRMLEDLGTTQLTEEEVEEYISENILKKGQVIPGFGHAVLRTTDPRFTLQKEFAEKVMPDDPLFRILCLCLKVVPNLLKKKGKVANPYPNVDAHSGIILNHFGLQEEKFFTVLFGISRCIGIISQIVWDRLLNFPIERPKSVTLKQLLDMVNNTTD